MKVKLIKKKADQWSGLKFYDNCNHRIGSYLTRSGKRYTGLDDADRERFEKILGKDLSPSSEFWDDFYVIIGRNKPEVDLDTEVPFEEFQYKFLRNGHKRIANGFNDNKPTAEYILIEEKATAEEINKKSRTKRQAFRELDKMSVTEMRKALRLYGHKSDTVYPEVVESTLSEIIEEDPDKFLSLWVNNKNKETQFLIEDASAKNIIKKFRTTYKYGTDVIGYTLEETIDYINNPANRDFKINLMAQIEGLEGIVKKTKATDDDSKAEATKLIEEIQKEIEPEVKEEKEVKTVKKTKTKKTEVKEDK